MSIFATLLVFTTLLPLVTGFSYILSRTKDKSSKYFWVATVLFVLGFIVFLGITHHIFSKEQAYVWSIPLGVLMSTVLFFLIHPRIKNIE